MAYYCNYHAMKKILTITLLIAISLITLGFSSGDVYDSFNIKGLYDYQKEYESEEVYACALGNSKTYMDYRATTDPSSVQYWFIRNNMEVDEVTGFLLDEDGFIGAALGSYFGNIGDRFYFTLDSGVVLPIVKVEEKADRDTDPTGCYHSKDGSVIEFVIDSTIAGDYFGRYGNGLVLQGNYANYSIFKGDIVKIEKATDTKREDYVTYVNSPEIVYTENIFEYASGY